MVSLLTTICYNKHPLNSDYIEQNMAYDASSVKVLKGLDAVKNAQACILATQMMVLAYTTWSLKY